MKTGWTLTAAIAFACLLKTKRPLPDRINRENDMTKYLKTVIKFVENQPTISIIF
jgi:hypothetical protein